MRNSPALVLVVEDDAVLNGHIATYLRRRGFAVAQAFEPDAAFDSMIRLRPDLVLVDVCLPGETGPEVLARAAARGAGRPPCSCPASTRCSFPGARRERGSSVACTSRFL